MQQFADSFDKLFGAIAQRRTHASRWRSRPPGDQTQGPPEMKNAFDAEMEVWRENGRIRQALDWRQIALDWRGRRQMGRLATALWSRNWPVSTGCIGFAEQVKQRRFTDFVLLGMGGSSLGPEVFGETFGRRAGWPRFHMLDSTDPAQIQSDRTARSISARRYSSSPRNPAPRWSPTFSWTIFSTVWARCAAKIRSEKTSSR